MSRWHFATSETKGWAIGVYFVVPAFAEIDRSLIFRLGHRNWTLQRDRDGQPWPEVSECHEQHKPGHVCLQHDPTHGHTWAAGKPSRYEGGVPVRCIGCGGRKCDDSRCKRLRHHSEPHTDWAHYYRPIGGSTLVGVS